MDSKDEELNELDRLNTMKSWGKSEKIENPESQSLDFQEKQKSKRGRKKKVETDSLKDFKAKSILPELKSYDEIPNDIKERADTIYKYIVNCNRELNIDLIKRSKYRQMLIFRCVYEAYDKADIPMIPSKLCKILGMKKSGIKKCSTEFSPLKLNYKGNERPVKPSNYFRIYLDEFNKHMPIQLDDSLVDKIMEFTKDLIERFPSLRNESPGTLYAGIFYYFVQEKHKIQIPAKILKEITENSNATDKHNLEKIKKQCEIKNIF